MATRAAKAEATKERIRAAAIKLYIDRPIEHFTLDEVAARAATTVQTVLRVFGNKEKLIYAMLEEMVAGGVPMKPTPPGDVAAFVGAIFDLYEEMGDLVMKRLNDEGRRPALKPSLDEGRANHRDSVELAFAPQLQRFHGSARTRLLHILLVATDVYVWKLLRRDHGLSRPAAEAVMRQMITGVMKGEASDGTDSMAQLVGRRESTA